MHTVMLISLAIAPPCVYMVTQKVAQFNNFYEFSHWINQETYNYIF